MIFPCKAEVMRCDIVFSRRPFLAPSSRRTVRPARRSTPSTTTRRAMAAMAGAGGAAGGPSAAVSPAGWGTSPRGPAPTTCRRRRPGRSTPRRPCSGTSTVGVAAAGQPEGERRTMAERQQMNLQAQDRSSRGSGITRRAGRYHQRQRAERRARRPEQPAGVRQGPAAGPRSPVPGTTIRDIPFQKASAAITYSMGQLRRATTSVAEGRRLRARAREMRAIAQETPEAR